MNVAGRRRRRRMAERAHLQWKGCLFHFVCLMLRLYYLCLVFVFLMFLCLHCFDAGKRNEAASLARQGFEAIVSLAINLQHPSV